MSQGKGDAAAENLAWWFNQAGLEVVGNWIISDGSGYLPYLVWLLAGLAVLCFFWPIIGVPVKLIQRHRIGIPLAPVPEELLPIRDAAEIITLRDRRTSQIWNGPNESLRAHYTIGLLLMAADGDFPLFGIVEGGTLSTRIPQNRLRKAEFRDDYSQLIDGAGKLYRNPCIRNSELNSLIKKAIRKIGEKSQLRLLVNRYLRTSTAWLRSQLGIGEGTRR